jgi:hypothetical protein
MIYRVTRDQWEPVSVGQPSVCLNTAELGINIELGAFKCAELRNFSGGLLPISWTQR